MTLRGRGDDPPDRPGRPVVVFPGSFNPVHGGHLSLGRIASEVLGQPVDFELSTRNAEKPPIEPDDLRRRIAGLRGAIGDDPAFGVLWLTGAPTFPEKARLFPGATFVVGLDTFRRIAEPRFYGGSAGLDAASGAMADLGARFLVFFRHADDLDGWDDPGRYPPPLAAMARFVDRDRYGDEQRLSSRLLRRPPSGGGRPDQRA